MRFVSRAQWGARYAKGSGRIPGPVYGVTLHWEGPKMGQFSHDKCAGKVRTIERFHAVTRGWSGIAYSAIVCPHGYVFEGRGTGVRSAANGTSGIGGNDHWYAVCYMSGQTDPFTDEAKAAFVDAVQWLRAKGGAGKRVNGHRDHHSTECPGDAIYHWLQTANFNSTTNTTVEDDEMSAEDVKRLDDKLDALTKAVASLVTEVGTDGVHVPKAHPDYNPKNTTCSTRRALELILKDGARLPETIKATLAETTVDVEVPK